MLSNGDLERLIIEKRREIEKEKIGLGLSSPVDAYEVEELDDKENGGVKKKSVRISEGILSERHDNVQTEAAAAEIPPDLERYIRRYLGLPVMLKAGEYSPNNPLVRAARAPGDVLRGLGEYERTQHTLRRLRQQQYREYLDQQAKKKQDEKEQAERERREREEKERQREEERERLRLQLEECTRRSEQRRASVCFVPTTANSPVTNGLNKKVDTAVQVGISKPLSVAVQTDDAELYRLSPSPTKCQLTQAERELSPRTVVDHDERPIHPAPWAKNDWDQEKGRKNDWEQEKGRRNDWEQEKGRRNDWEQEKGRRNDWEQEKGRRNDWEQTRKTEWEESRADRNLRRRSYGDFDDRSPSLLHKPSRERLLSDLRHTYMPSIFDADAIHMRNLQAEKEAAERRQFYQQELKNQILEQQRIREERKTREKMLEQAEMRRLEEQLRMLRVAQEKEVGKQRDITAAIKENASEFEKKRTTLQKEIDYEHQKILRAHHKRNTTALSDTTQKLPTFTSREDKRPPYSTNIPENSIFSPNYDVDSYLRKNLNPKKDILPTNLDKIILESKDGQKSMERNDLPDLSTLEQNYKLPKERNYDNVVVEKALIHERPKERNKPKYEPSFLKHLDEIPDDTPIPVLKHNAKENSQIDGDVVEGMKLVENKWKVPAVQKNILKSLPKDDGKNVSILTQLGSIRRQLQLEQLRLDNMVPKSD